MASPAAAPGGGSGRGGGAPAMRAAVLQRHGEPPRFGQHPAPGRRPGQALIRITAAPINPLDLLCASGTSYFGPPELPYVPGTQGVGTVAEADSAAVGQRVWFSCAAGMAPGDGSMAELCVAPETALLPVPDGVSDDLAAALGLSAVAAWMALSWRGQLQPGEHVLVLGASGNVGQIAVQAARLLGAGRVVAACRDAQGRARATELGADAVADLSGEDIDAVAGRLAQAAGDRVDLVLDPVWGVPAEAASRVLSPNGRLVNLGSSAGALAGLSSAALRSRVLSVLGYTNNALTDEQKTAALAGILAHAADGRITADRETLPLDRAAEGWARCGQAPHARAILTP
ncbi:MAG TPA: zinc-binding dehydrogenase [Streptosporangiaceae bacterium]|nr:zinc-binding dehydrogenase [Streptosporangiaceae bacterium]